MNMTTEQLECLRNTFIICNFEIIPIVRGKYQLIPEKFKAIDVETGKIYQADSFYYNGDVFTYGEAQEEEWVDPYFMNKDVREFLHKDGRNTQSAINYEVYRDVYVIYEDRMYSLLRDNQPTEDSFVAIDILGGIVLHAKDFIVIEEHEEYLYENCAYNKEHAIYAGGIPKNVQKLLKVADSK